MSAPFYEYGLFGEDTSLVVALVLGLAFGWFLERGGMGNARKLAGQFYLTDLAVFKIMFSAIVTAMLGIVIASSIGLVDLRAASESIASWTWIWPMLVGGFVLGVGFIVSGYCPGTSAVAASSGHVDGIFTFGGVIIGTFLYSELQQLEPVSRFHVSGEKGAWFLYDLLGVPAAILAAIVTIVAIAAFFGAEKVERIFAARDAGASQTSAPSYALRRRFAWSTFAVFAAVALIGLAAPDRAVASSRGTTGSIRVEDLARRIVEEPWTLRIIDLRPSEAFNDARIPGSENVDPSILGDLGLRYMPVSREIIIVGPEGMTEVPDEVAAYKGASRMLEGGWSAWNDYALTAPEAPPADSGAGAREEYLFRAALHASLTGANAPPPPPAPNPTYVPKPKKKGGGCST